MRPEHWVGTKTAGVVVRIAIKSGELPAPQSLRCADCGAPAFGYDHRDYNAPLKVDAVCRGCNTRRGPAIPRRGALQRIVERGGVPYKRATSVRQVMDALGIDTARIALPAQLRNAHWRALLPLFIEAEAVAAGSVAAHR